MNVVDVRVHELPEKPLEPMAKLSVVLKVANSETANSFAFFASCWATFIV
jgi:hypothetical protein